MNKQANQLGKTLGVWSGTAMDVSLVIGAGILVVPGIAYYQVGTSAVYSWILNSFFIIPLLLIFAHLGARYPNAGGISGFTQEAFGRDLAAATEILMVGTFSLALPGVAFTAASYLGETFNLNIWQVTLVAFEMLLLAIVINVMGTKLASKLQQVLAYLLVVLLLAVTLSVFMLSPLNGEGIAPIHQWSHAVETFGLVFFAYAGWELLAFTSEEYKDPKRDFPRVIAISFILVSGLYILIAVALQLTFHHTDPRLLKTPIAMLFEISLGVYSKFFVSLCGFIIIMVHLIGAIWGASRLVFSSARAGILSAPLARIHHNQVPVNAVLAIGSLLLGVAAVTATGSITVTTLFTLAGQNFFILSGFAVLAYLKMAANNQQKLLGWLTAIMVFAVTATFGIKLLYPLFLLLVGYLLSRSKMQLGVEK